MKAKIIEWSIGIGFTLFGGLFFIIGIIAVKSSIDFKKNALEETAIVYDIQNYVDDDGDVNHTAYVKYFVEDKEYNEAINYYNSSMKVGNEIKIYYDPNFPTQIQVEGSSTFLFIFPCMGLIFFLVGILMIINKIKKITGKNELMKNGIQLDAIIEDVILNTSYSVNNRNPYVINCKVTDITNNGAIYLVKTDNIWFNPSSIIQQNNITSFPIYMDNKNKEKYYISLDKLNQKITDLR